MKFFLFLLTVCLFSFSSFSQQNWQQVYKNGFNSSRYDMGSAPNGYVYALSNDLANYPLLIRSNANGYPGTWATLPLPPALTNVKFSHAAFNGADIYISNGTSFFRSGDYGSSFQNLQNVPAHIVYYAQFHFLPWGNVILSNSSSGGLYRSIDRGETWVSVLNTNADKIIQKQAETYAFTNTDVYKSGDLGATWTNLNATLPTADWHYVVLLSNDSFLIVHNQDVFMSADAITWSLKPSTGLHNEPTQCLDLIKAPVSDSLFLLREKSATMNAELLLSTDRGATWVSYQNGISKFGNPYADRLYMSVDGYLFLSGTNSTIYKMPQSFALIAPHANKYHSKINIYPNPVTDRLIIEGAKAGTELSIRNMMGQQVYHGSTLNGNKVIDVSGLPTGNYVLQLIDKSGNHINRKIVKE